MFDYKDWKEEILNYLDQETGTDDIIYGNYVEWDRFRKDYEEELLAEACIELPWGKILSMQEYIDLSSELSNLGVKSIEYLNEILDSEVKFIDRDNKIADIIVSECLDLYGVPCGTEYEQELPTELTYWNNMLDSSESELLAYINYPIEVNLFDEKINNIFSKIEATSDELTKKSLLLAAFSITESMFKSVIVNKIPQENNISDFSKKILAVEIDKKLRGKSDIKNQLFKELYNTPAPQQNWINVRNSLAHDIESSSIINEQITYLNLKTKNEETYLLSELKNSLMDFFDNIKNILAQN
ncbi:hypothetical protein HMPREF3188_00446 [Tissierellia bacterium KA00581]|nr:hypothetical protein HMPREF3188_00446 [Tissierellia bacterium KA00581]